VHKSKFRRTATSVATTGLVAATAAEAAASTAESGVPAMVSVLNLATVVSARVLDNGEVELTLENGAVIRVAEADATVENGVVQVSESVVGIVEQASASAAADAASAYGDSGGSIGADALLIAGGIVAGGVGIAAAAGAFDGNDEEEDVNTVPNFTSGTSASIGENQTATGYTASAIDGDGDAVTFAIAGGADAASFAIDQSTGVLTFVAAPDFEAPGDADGDNNFEVIIAASDGEATVQQTVTVSVTNENDVAPVITSGAEATATENQTAAYTATAEDAEGDAVTFSISGTDAALFAVDAATGAVTFLAAPDFENPADADGDNVYEIEVIASDGVNTATQAVTITVADTPNIDGDAGNNVLVGTAEVDEIGGGAGDDRIESGNGADFVITGSGADDIVFQGDPFQGADVSAEGRQVVGGEDFLADFDFAADQYFLNAGDAGVNGDVQFAAVDANAPDAAIAANTNVVVLLNSDNDGDPATVFNAGAAANQIADLVSEDGAGFFVYFNSGLGVNRLVYSSNLNDAGADLSIIARQTDLTGQDAIDALGNFSAANFVFENVGQTIFDIASGSSDFDILEAALVATGLDGVVDDAAAAFTVFAPTDGAFALLAQDLGIDTAGLSDEAITGEIVGALETIAGGEAEGLALLSDVLLYHVSPGVQDLASLQMTGTITTALTDATFDVNGTTLEDNDLTIVDPQFVEGLTDLAASNGLIQVIDRVLLPVDVAGDDQSDDTVVVNAVADGDVINLGANTVANATSAADINTGDTIDLSGLTEAASVDLDVVNQGALNGNPTPSQEGSLTVGGQVATLIEVENVIGTGFDDTLFGNQESNVILGGAGNDNIHPFGGVDFVDGGDGVDTLNLSGATGLTIDLAAGVAGPNTFVNFENVLGSVNGNDVILGDAGVNDLNGRDGDDVLNGRGGADILTGGAGADLFGFNGDPFDGMDVSAAGRQIIGSEDFVTDFDFASDAYQLDAGNFGISGDVSFFAVDANTAAPGAVPDDTNVIVLLNSDNDGDPATPFLAGTAANQIADLVDTDGAGFFVYFNSNLGVNRLVYSLNLNDANADLKIVSRQTDLTDQDAIDALGNFSAANFVFENVVAGFGPAVSFDEAISGDLSDDIANPTDLSLGLGANTLTAGQQGNSFGRDIDYITIDVPEGLQLSQIILDDYTGGDGAGFIGIQRGEVFTVDADNAAPADLLGGAVYGDAQEGSDILDDIGALAGSEGFTGPLPAGTYTIWLNQTGAPSSAIFTLLTEEAGTSATASGFSDLSVGVETADSTATMSGVPVEMMMTDETAEPVTPPMMDLSDAA